MQYLIEHKAEVLAVLFALSELIGAHPGVKSSGVLSLIINSFLSFRKPQQ